MVCYEIEMKNLTGVWFGDLLTTNTTIGEGPTSGGDGLREKRVFSKNCDLRRSPLVQLAVCAIGSIANFFVCSLYVGAPIANAEFDSLVYTLFANVCSFLTLSKK